MYAMPNGLRETTPQGEREHGEGEAESPSSPNVLRQIVGMRARRSRREFIKLTGGACVGADGQLDPEKVKTWQSHHGLDPDGKVGQKTLQAARKAAKGGGGHEDHGGGHEEQGGHADTHGGGGHTDTHGGGTHTAHEHPPDSGHGGGQATGGGGVVDDTKLLEPNFDAPKQTGFATAKPTGGTAKTTAPLGYDGAAFKAAIVGNQLANALRLAMRKPEQAMTDLAALGVEAQFFALLRGGKPYSAPMRTQLGTLYHKSKLAEKRQLFAAQFSVTVEKGGAQDFTEGELDNLYDQARVLPPSHVEGQANFVRLMRSTNALAEGTAGGGRITMDAMKNAARYSQVFRHEVGHTVDSTLGGECDKLRVTDAGWTQYATPDAWIGALGGYGDIPKELQPKVHAAVAAYMGPGSTFNSPTPKFWDTLALHVSAEELKQLAKLAGNPLLGACTASQGNCNYFRFTGWPVLGGKAFFINHYYAKGYSIGGATFTNLKAWGNVAAAFSDKEWFAEVYADYYQNGAGGAHTAFPDFVETFMKNKVDKLAPSTPPSHGGGTATAVATVEPPVDQALPGAGKGGGGGNPTVPR
jgi:Putative peptidoglycan binding domain